MIRAVVVFALDHRFLILAAAFLARIIFASFPDVTQVVSQVARPDDGTDTASFYNSEYFFDLKPKQPHFSSFLLEGFKSSP